MIQIWKKTENGEVIVTQLDTMEKAEYFAEKNRIENPIFIKVLN